MTRKRGSLNRRTDSLIRAVDHAPGDDLLERLSHLAEDEQLPLRMRLDAVKLLSGALHGRIRLNHAAKAMIAENMAAEPAT
jgi:hypothetical protein